MPFLLYCVASNLSAGYTTTKVLRLVTVGHWAQNGDISAQHIRGDYDNVIEHTNQEDLLLKVIEIFSFQGNTVVNVNGDATKGGNNNILINHHALIIVCANLHYECTNLFGS